MSKFNAAEPNASHVTALYRDGWEQFDLPDGATLVELAGHLSNVAVMHQGSPVSIKVQLSSGRRLARSQQRYLDLNQVFSLVDGFVTRFSSKPLHTRQNEL